MQAQVWATFLHHGVTRLKRLSSPVACWIRKRPWERIFGKKPGLVHAVLRGKDGVQRHASTSSSKIILQNCRAFSPSVDKVSGNGCMPNSGTMSSTLPSRSWMLAVCTSASISRPCVSTRT